MKKDSHITQIIFRVDKDNEIFALFPHEVSNNNGDVTCYQHIGQHSSADYTHCIKQSKIATPTQSLPLYQELISLGYNLEVIRKQNRSLYIKSYNKIK